MDTGNLDVRDFSELLIAISHQARRVCEESIILGEEHDTGSDVLNLELQALRALCATLDTSGDANGPPRAAQDAVGDSGLAQRVRSLLESLVDREDCVMPFGVPCAEAIEEAAEEDFCEACRAAAILADWKEEG